MLTIDLTTQNIYVEDVPGPGLIHLIFGVEAPASLGRQGRQRRFVSGLIVSIDLLCTDGVGSAR